MVVAIAKPTLVSCNFPTLKNPNWTTPSLQPHKHNPQRRRRLLLPHTHRTTASLASGRCCFSCFKPQEVKTKAPFAAFRRKGSGDSILICHDSKKESEVSGSEGVDGRDWTTSILLFFLWAALMYYVFFLSPNQTPVIIKLH